MRSKNGAGGHAVYIVSGRVTGASGWVCRSDGYLQLSTVTAKARSMGKRKITDEKSRKKSKTGLLLPHAEIKSLAAEVVYDRKYNNLVPLLQQYELAEPVFLDREDSQIESTCRLVTVELYKVFQKLVELGRMEETDSEKTNIVHRWIKDKYEKFQSRLCWFLETKLAYEASIQLDSLDIMLGLVKTEARDGEFPAKLYQKLVSSLVSSDVGTVLPDCNVDNFIIVEFLAKFSRFWDLQVYFFDEQLVEAFSEWKSADKLRKAKIFANYFTIIRNGLLSAEEIEEKCPQFTKAALQEPALEHVQEDYQGCLIAAMRFKSLSAAEYKALLRVLHRRVLPYMVNPAGLMDFLTDAYDQQEDEVVPILALNSLWELMKLHNLEYPHFYTKLYLLITPNVLYTKYRSRFFRLCDLFLSSTHLSANLVASFIKRLARVALVASAPGVVIVIPFVYNLLKRHPVCMVMLQNTTTDEYTDTFDNTETDPLKTGAIGSSLWELETLMSHYHPNIATLARLFKEPFRKPSYNMEDFLDWSYISLLGSEKTRKYKGMAALEYQQWDSLYGENGFVEGWAL